MRLQVNQLRTAKAARSRLPGTHSPQSLRGEGYTASTVPQQSAETAARTPGRLRPERLLGLSRPRAAPADAVGSVSRRERASEREREMHCPVCTARCGFRVPHRGRTEDAESVRGPRTRARISGPQVEDPALRPLFRPRAVHNLILSAGHAGTRRAARVRRAIPHRLNVATLNVCYMVK